MPVLRVSKKKASPNDQPAMPSSPGKSAPGMALTGRLSLWLAQSRWKRSPLSAAVTSGTPVQPGTGAGCACEELEGTPGGGRGAPLTPLDRAHANASRARVPLARTRKILRAHSSSAKGAHGRGGSHVFFQNSDRRNLEIESRNLQHGVLRLCARLQVRSGTVTALFQRPDEKSWPKFLPQCSGRLLRVLCS